MSDLKKYADKLSESGIKLTGRESFAYTDGVNFYLAADCDLNNPNWITVALGTPAARVAKDYGADAAVLFSAFVAKKFRYLLITFPDYAGVIGREGITVPPILDDMAQIVGPTLRNVTFAKLRRGIGGRCAATLTDGRLVSVGRTGKEAVTAALVAEKACRCYKSAALIGSAKAVPMAEAYLMQLVYRLKYSKQGIKED